MKWHSNESDRDNELSAKLKTDHSITENTWQAYINNATDTNLGQRKLNVLNTLAKLIINQHSQQNQVDNLQFQLNQEQSAHQATKTKLETIPNDWDQQIKTAQSERDTALKEKESYQNQLTEQEQQIVQQLNSTFNLKLDPAEKDLSKAIVEIQKLISKDPLVQTVDNPALQEQLNQAQETITLLQEQLTSKTTPFGQSLEVIREVDEKMLSQILSLKVELNQQSQDYQSLAQERNALAMKEITNINVIRTMQLLPSVQKTEVQKVFEQVKSYDELAQARNKLITANFQQKLTTQQNDSQTNQLTLMQNQKQERIILVSLLVVSLVSISGLLMKLRGVKK